MCISTLLIVSSVPFYGMKMRYQAWCKLLTAIDRLMIETLEHFGEFECNDNTNSYKDGATSE